MDNENPLQQLYTALLVKLNKAYPGMVYDGWMPPADTPYPFIFLGDVSENADLGKKITPFGRATIAVHAWHNDFRKRGDLSTLMMKIRMMARNIETEHYGWCLSGCEERYVKDTTTKDALLHGVLYISYKYWRK